jgi:endonuclease-3
VDGEGTYTLVIELGAPARITFGASGERDLPAGWYAYVGSAFGPGGFARVDRHRELARGERDVRHWHVDSLLGHPESRLDGARTTNGAEIECAVARSLAGAATPVDGVGATDCDCDAHLAFASERDAVRKAVRAAHEEAGSGTEV